MEPNQRAPKRPLLALLGFAAVTTLAAALGARTTARGKLPWYRLIRKSHLNPPDWVFGPVWTTLFALTAYSGFRIWRAPPSPARSRALTLWTAQLALNANWSRLFFGQHRPTAAFVDLGALLASLGGYVQQAKRVDKPAAYLMAPYLGWVSFAGYLNEEVIRKNPRFLSA
jgi:tryptophan-rich sensory protein